MTEDLTGLEWFFGLEGLKSRFQGLLGLSDAEIQKVLANWDKADVPETQDEFRKRVRVDDVLLVGSSDDERWAERLWMAQLKKRTLRLIGETRKLLESLPLADDARAKLVSHIEELVAAGIQSGPYQPWIERVAGLKQQKVHRQARAAQAELASGGLSKKTTARADLVWRHAANAPRKKNGDLLRPGDVRDAVNGDLPKDEQINSDVTIQRLFRRARDRQT